MRTLKYLGILAFSAWFAVAAVPDSGDSAFPYALIHGSCAPWDGPAVEVTLTKEPAQCKRTDGPYIAMGIWRGLPIHAGQEVSFGNGSDAGFASQCAKEGECERAQSGTIVFDKYDENSSASGRYELHFKGGKTLTGKFEAKFCHERVFCG